MDNIECFETFSQNYKFAKEVFYPVMMRRYISFDPALIFQVIEDPELGEQLLAEARKGPWFEEYRNDMGRLLEELGINHKYH